MRRVLLRVLLPCFALLLASAALAWPVHACTSGIEHEAGDLVVFHHDGIEVTIVRTLLRPQSMHRGGPIATVIAIPTAPLAHRLLPAGAFDDIEPRTGSGRIVRARARVIPVRTTGERGRVEVSRALRGINGGLPSARGAEHYLGQSGALFAMRATLPSLTETSDCPGTSCVGIDNATAELPSLAVAFRSDAITLPLKMHAADRELELGVTIVSSRQVVASPIGHGFGAPRTLALDDDQLEALRDLVRPLVRDVPELRGILTASLSVVRYEAARLDVDFEHGDPSIALGAPVSR